VDRAANRLYLVQYGRYDDETARSFLSALEAGVAELSPGFDVVNDVREFQPLEQQKTEYIERGKETVAEGGVTALVRVVDSTVTKLQFDRAGDGDDAYQVGHAETVREAEAMLDDLRAGR